MRGELHNDGPRSEEEGRFQKVDFRDGTSYFAERKKGVISVRPMGQRGERLGTVLGVSVFEAA